MEALHKFKLFYEDLKKKRVKHAKAKKAALIKEWDDAYAETEKQVEKLYQVATKTKGKINQAQSKKKSPPRKKDSPAVNKGR